MTAAAHSKSEPHVRGAATKRRQRLAELSNHRALLEADLYRHSLAACLAEDAGGDVTLYATGLQH